MENQAHGTVCALGVRIQDSSKNGPVILLLLLFRL